MEFALIAPVAVVMMSGVSDIARAVILQQEVYSTAHIIPVSASSLAVQPDKTTSLTVTQVQQTLSAIFAAMPWRRSGSANGLTGVAMSSVAFSQVDSSCVGTMQSPCKVAPHVAWSVPYADPPSRNAGGSNTFEALRRPCGQLNQTMPGVNAPSDLTSLPTLNVSNPDAILVVDVHYQFTPLVFSFITGPVDFWASGYWAVRSVDPNVTPANQYTKYDVANQAGGVGKCAGYP